MVFRSTWKSYLVYRECFPVVILAMIFVHEATWLCHVIRVVDLTRVCLVLVVIRPTSACFQTLVCTVDQLFLRTELFYHMTYQAFSRN